MIEQIATATGLNPDTVQDIGSTLIVVLACVLIRFAIFRVIRTRLTDVRQAYHWRRAITFTLTIIAIALIARIWFSLFEDIGTFLGLLSAGLAVALSDLLANLAGWVFILTRRPYVVGDRIKVDGHMGDVIDIRLFTTFLLECGNWVDADQATGRIIMIPNGSVFRKTTANFTRSFEHIWDEIHVLVTFESDWKLAKKILEEIAQTKLHTMSSGVEDQIRRAASKHMIFFQKLTPIVYTDVKDSGIQLTIRFLTLPRSRRSTSQTVWEAILNRFADEPHIDFAYPTIRYFANQLEAKPEMRAVPDPH